MPLVWAHSEFVKLCYGRALGRPVDRPAAPGLAIAAPARSSTTRSGGRMCACGAWRRAIDPIIALKAPATVHWGVNNWRDVRDVETSDTGLACISSICRSRPTAGESVQFTVFWLGRSDVGKVRTIRSTCHACWVS